jgi:mannose-6-phosphate isomerase-like protein (cupin superfamily)
MNIRCIVTGRSKEGKSIVVRDSEVAPVTAALLPGYEFHRLWGAESAPELPGDGANPVPPAYFPPAGGFRFGFFTIPPHSEKIAAQVDLFPALAELQQKLPGLVEVMEPDRPGMHTTDTVDYDVVVSGEVWMELDDGAEVHLKAGDCLVQNGTRHAWHNRSDQPCVIAVTLIGAAARQSV